VSACLAPQFITPAAMLAVELQALSNAFAGNDVSAATGEGTCPCLLWQPFEIRRDNFNTAAQDFLSPQRTFLEA